MTTMADLVADVRANLNGALPDIMIVLAEDYVPGSGSISLKYPTRALRAGVQVSIGLTTFYVLEVGSSNSTATVVAGHDGSPDVAHLANAVGYIRPRATTFDIFRRLSDEISGLGSPMLGLFGVATWTAPSDTTYGTYVVPTAYESASRVLEVLWLAPGTPDGWIAVNNFVDDEANGERVIRVRDGIPAGTTVQFTVAMPFTRPTDLTTDIEACGLSEETKDIPALGATASLLAVGEARRLQPFSQGDPRRAEELQPGASVSLSREWSRSKRDRVQEEHARLIRKYPWMQRVV